jgi:hypothetical protein
VIQSLGWGDVLFSANGAIRAAQNLTARSVPVWSYLGANGHGPTVDVPEYLFVVEMMLEWFGHWLQGLPLENAESARFILADDRPAWPHHEVTSWPQTASSTFPDHARLCLCPFWTSWTVGIPEHVCSSKGDVSPLSGTPPHV